MAHPTASQRQESAREATLVPLRYDRMSTDPFAFLRGAAAAVIGVLAIKSLVHH